MAENNNQSPTGISEEDASLQQGSAPQRRFRPVPGRPEVVRIGKRFLGDRAIVKTVNVDGQPVVDLSAKVNSKSEIVLKGEGLGNDNFDFWEVARQGKKSLPFSQITLQNDSQVLLNLKNLEGSLQEGESFGIAFFSSRFGGRMRLLSLVFTLESKAEQDKQKNAALGEQEEQARRAKEAVDAQSLGPTGVMIASMNDLFRQIEETVAGESASATTSQPATSTTIKDIARESNLSGPAPLTYMQRMEQEMNEDGEDEEQAAEVSAEAETQQSITSTTQVSTGAGVVSQGGTAAASSATINHSNTASQISGEQISANATLTGSPASTVSQGATITGTIRTGGEI